MQATAVCVRERVTTLRKGPGENFKKSWLVGKYMPFEQLGRQGDWLKLKDVDGEIHWGHGVGMTRDIYCVVVKAPAANLRTGPGENFAKADIWLADKYTPFKKLREENSWLQVENSRGQKFWLHKKNVWEPIIVQTISF